MTGAFKVYVSVMLFIIAALLAALTAAIIVVGVKLHDASGKITSFNQKASSIDTTLKSIRTELQTSNTNSLPSSLLSR